MKRFIVGLYLITAICGLVDAVCFLALGGVFAEIMTGNFMFLAFSIGTGHDVEAISKFIIPIAAFIIGAIVGGRLLHGPDTAKEKRVGFIVEYGLLVVATLIAIIGSPHANNISGQLIVALLALAMGLQNALIRYHGVPDLATNVMTLTFAAVFAESKLAGWDNRKWPRRTASIGLFVSSAVSGAFLLRFGIFWPLVAASLIFSIALIPLMKGKRPSA
jgi:uncharacterized membrane protein YoaK (UPF0700 family)